MMMKPALGRARRAAFTLIEVLIVVVILGILASIVVFGIGEFENDAAIAAFVTSGEAFAESAQRYHLETGQWLEDSSSGVLPAGFEDYITISSWVGGTPIGGVWDSEFNSFGIISGIGVHFDGTGTTHDATYMTEVDAKFDDGDLTRGGFRQIAADRYYFVLAD